MPTPQKTIYINYCYDIDNPKVNQLMAICSQLINQQKPDVLYFCLASPGGFIAPGIVLHNFLHALPVQIIMHNIGSVDSVATIIFLAGACRYAVPNSSFLFHGVNTTFDQKTSLTPSQLREHLNGLEQDQKKISNIITQSTKITPEELDSLFIQGETKTPEFALEKGFIHEIKPLSIEPNALLVSFVPQQSSP